MTAVRLGANQKTVLKMLIKNDGRWHRKAPWSFDGPFTTDKIMKSLLLRSLVSAAPEVIDGERVTLYRITEAGKLTVDSAIGTQQIMHHESGTGSRCPSCQHLSMVHAPTGCTYSITNPRQGLSARCACAFKLVRVR